jgi:uncharacterized membrane protein YdbT with pleckstrin-like domain
MESGYTLDPQEEIIRRVKRHWIALAPVAVSVGAIILIILGGSYGIARYRDQVPAVIPTSAIAGVLALLLVLALFILLTGVWVYNRNVMLLTTKHLIRVEQRGLFSRSVSQLSLSRVQDVSSSTPGFLATILGFGNVTVQTAGEEDNFIFTTVPSPSKLAEDCLSAHDTYANTPVAA